MTPAILLTMSNRWRVTRTDTGQQWTGEADDAPEAARLGAKAVGVPAPGALTRAGVYDWTATGLTIRRLRPSSGTSGSTMTQAEREASGTKRLDTYIADDAVEALARGVALYGSKRAAVEAALRLAFPEKRIR